MVFGPKQVGDRVEALRVVPRFQGSSATVQRHRVARGAAHEALGTRRTFDPGSTVAMPVTAIGATACRSACLRTSPSLTASAH